MNVHELQRRLDEIGVPKNAYSILLGGLPNEMLCIVKDGSLWEVYYSERGRRSGLKTFEDEDSACGYFFDKLKKYGIIPK